MPRIIIQSLEGRSLEQKRELVRRITVDVVDVYRVTPDQVTVFIEEASPENFAKGGVLEADKRAGVAS